MPIYHHHNTCEIKPSLQEQTAVYLLTVPDPEIETEKE